MPTLTNYVVITEQPNHAPRWKLLELRIRCSRHGQRGRDDPVVSGFPTVNAGLELNQRVRRLHGAVV